ncbi:Apocarotenoid-15,15'-oxygenase, partial [bacterium]|nr:Apocarotenoid-15,15'-oxygenase [bacterium]
PGFAFLHDMAITPNYCIFAQNPVLLNPIPYVLGFKAAGQCLQFRADQPTKLLLIPRHGGQMRILETQACFVFHHANAWEEGDKVYLDSICYEYFPNVEPDADYLDVDFESYPAGQLWRFEMDLSADSVTYQVVESRPCEFPALHPDRTGQPHRYLYLGTTHSPARNAPLQAFVKIDNQTGDRQVWSLAPRGFAGEPTFVPRPSGTAEDDGWLLSLVYDAAHHRSDLLIFNAQRLNEGPIAKLHLNYHIPYGLHGYFTGEYFAPSNM